MSTTLNTRGWGTIPGRRPTPRPTLFPGCSRKLQAPNRKNRRKSRGRTAQALPPREDSSLLFVIVGICRMVRNHDGILFQGFHRDFHGLFELTVVPCRYRRRIIFYFNVWGDAAVLHFPIAVQTINRHARRSDEAAVQQRWIVVNADQPAPRLRANQWPDFVLLEHPWQRVAARAGHFVDDHCLGSVNLRQWRTELLPFAGDGAVPQRTP